MYSKSLCIFRRDLRIPDNTALAAATLASQSVIPCFIFDPRQIGDTNIYRSTRCAEFMVQSLEDLHEQFAKQAGRLFLFHGIAEDIIDDLVKRMHIDAVYINRDYTPFALARDKAIENVAKKYQIDFHAYDDILLNAPHEIYKNDGSPYVKFTPFYHKALTIPVKKPQKNTRTNYFTGTITHSYTIAQMRELFSLVHHTTTDEGGRAACLRIVQHDLPTADGTTHLSPHMKFTTCSPREIYYALQKALPHPEPLLRQLYWRDFFTHIGAHFPHVFTTSFNSVYQNIAWKNDPASFARWCEGTTGFPIVDAGMRQLQETGWIPNRVRLIVASFLTKDLHLHWHLGERFFAQSLIDYDPAVNNGNWQWVAGTGCDAQPYFRIFNPWLQQKKFDPACVYIKRWVPELRSEEPAVIHQWHKQKSRASQHGYPQPMVDHQAAAAEAIKLFHALRKS